MCLLCPFFPNASEALVFTCTLSTKRLGSHSFPLWRLGILLLAKVLIPLKFHFNKLCRRTPVCVVNFAYAANCDFWLTSIRDRAGFFNPLTIFTHLPHPNPLPLAITNLISKSRVFLFVWGVLFRFHI